MVQITLFEIHLDDASFEANAPFSGEEESDSAAEEGASYEFEPDESATGGPSKVVPLVVGLVVLVGLAALVRKLRGGDEDAQAADGGVDPVDVETP